MMESILALLDGCDQKIAALSALGAFVLASFALTASGAIYRTFLRPGKNLKKLGKWAVVTGCTDGIGKAYAQGFAKKGLSVVLISRTEAKLQALKDEIDAKGYPGVETMYIVCDYSNFDQKTQDAVEAAIKNLDVGVLVNNVGVSYRYPRFFHELPDEEVANLIEMNVNSTTWMTNMVLPGMLDRRRGAVVNMSSGSAMYSLPLLAQYSAAKSYIVSFSRALNAEYASKGVYFQCQIPFYVATKLAKMRKSFMVPTPDQYVALGMKFIGQKDSIVSPYWAHAFQGWVMSIMAESFVTKQIMAMHLGIRKRGLKKDAAKKAE